MPVIFGRSGLSCAASEDPKQQAAKKKAICFIRILPNFDMRRVALGYASLFWTGVGAGEFGAARFLFGSEFHELDASVVGIVDVKLPFAVAADFGLFGEFDSGFRELVGDDVYVWDADRDVVHHAACVFIGSG